MNWEDAVGKHCLVNLIHTWSDLREVMIIRLSSSEKYVKYRFPNENETHWMPVHKIELLEILNYD